MARRTLEILSMGTFFKSAFFNFFEIFLEKTPIVNKIWLKGQKSQNFGGIKTFILYRWEEFSSLESIGTFPYQLLTTSWKRWWMVILKKQVEKCLFVLSCLTSVM